MVVITTDHGHYLGEHGWTGKPNAPYYNTLASTPLLIWHPDNPRPGGRTSALTSAVDLYATMLDALGAPVPTNGSHLHSRSLTSLLRDEADRHRDWALYGYWGSSLNVTDGRWTYFQPCEDGAPAEIYSTMMLNPGAWFYPPAPHLDAEGGRFLPYTDSPVWRYRAPSYSRHEDPMLFDVQTDPGQTHDLAAEQPEETQRMRELLVQALRELEAPKSQYRRLGLG
jgi:arylsulfatase A-like enzyme